MAAFSASDLEIFDMRGKRLKCIRGQSFRLKSIEGAEGILQKRYNPCKCQRVIMKGKSFCCKPVSEIIIISERWKEVFYLLFSKHLTDAPNVPFVNPRDLICVAFERGFKSLEILKTVLVKVADCSSFEIFYKGKKLYDISQIMKSPIPDDGCFEIELINIKDTFAEVTYALNYVTSVRITIECHSTDTFEEISQRTLDELGIDLGAEMVASLCLGTRVLEHYNSICSIDIGPSNQSKGRFLSRQKGGKESHTLALTLHVFHQTSSPIVINISESEQTTAFIKKEDTMKELHNIIGKAIQRHPSSFQICVQTDRSRKGKKAVIYKPAEILKECEISFLDRVELECTYENHTFMIKLFKNQSVQELKSEVSKHIGKEPFLFDLVQGNRVMSLEDFVDRFADGKTYVVSKPERRIIRMIISRKLEREGSRQKIMNIHNDSVTTVDDILHDVASYLNIAVSGLLAVHNDTCLKDTMSVKESNIQHMDTISIAEIEAPFELPFSARVVCVSTMEGSTELKPAVMEGGILFYAPGRLSIEDSMELFSKYKTEEGRRNKTSFSNISETLSERQKDIPNAVHRKRRRGDMEDGSPIRPENEFEYFGQSRSNSVVEMSRCEINHPCLQTFFTSASTLQSSDVRKGGKLDEDNVSLYSGKSPSVVSSSSKDFSYGSEEDILVLDGIESHGNLLCDSEDSDY